MAILSLPQCVNTISKGWTKWPTLRRWHFLEWEVLHFDSNFTLVCCWGSNWQYVSINSGNGLALHRQQAVTWTNDDKVIWCHMAALGCNYSINSLAPGRFQFNFRKVIFKLTLVNGGWSISYEIALRWMPQDLTDDKSNIGSGNGLVPWGNKPLPEPMLTQIYVIKWRH